VALFPSTSPTSNGLLAALPADVLATLLPKLNRVPLPLRHSLCRAEQPMEAVYFLEAGIASMVVELAEGMEAEVGIIGREGMTGTSLLHGVSSSFTEGYMQVAGSGLTMAVTSFRQELAANPPLYAIISLFVEAHQAQVAQTAACNSRHGLEQRLARWLLMAQDRIGDSRLPLTQEFMAMMLGVHRPSVTVTAGILQRAGLIQYGQGVITVLDRAGLKEASCECYAAARQRFESVMRQS